MEDRSSVIFGNRMPEKVSKKAKDQNRNIFGNLEMTATRIILLSYRKIVI